MRTQLRPNDAGSGARAHEPMAWLRRLVALLGFGGGALFAAAFLYSWVDPGQVERQAREAIQAEVSARVGTQIERLDGSRLSAVARRLTGESKAGVELARQQLREGLPAKIATIVAQMQDANCACRTTVEASVTGWFESGVDIQEAMQARLESLIRSKYREVAGQIVREFRIFTGVNALVLLLLGFAVVARRKAGVHLVPAAIVLVAASIVVGYFYLFQQDWLHTLLFGDYVGLWYVAYLAIAALMLGDILLNRARVTAHILNAALAALGAAVSVLPC